jgi:membrane associated rhomboid family serine protease
LSAGSRLPIVTLLLIAANILTAFALLWQPDLIDEFGYRPARPSAGDLLTSLFLHQNLLHLLGNMVFLAAVGAAVELATGSLRFATVYFAGGIAGVLTHHLFTPAATRDVPLVGASACVAACAAYYTARYVTVRVPVAPSVGVPILAVTLLWFSLQLLGAVFTLGEEVRVATSFWAHLGGFAAGLLLTLFFRAPDLGQRRLGHEVLDAMNRRSPAAALLAAERHLARHPSDPKALWEVVDAARLMGDAEMETGGLLELLEVLPESEQPELLARLAELGRLGRLTPLRRSLMADRHRLGHPDLARALFRSVIEEPENEPQRPEALLALAGLELEREEAAARPLLEELMTRYPLHPAAEVARARGWTK